MAERRGKKRVAHRKIPGREAIRRQGYRLLRRRVSQARIAWMLGVDPTTVWRWKGRMEKQGPRSWSDRPIPGRPPQLTRKQKGRLVEMLKEGPQASGYPTPLWTLKRLREVIDREFSVEYPLSGVWRVLRDLGFSAQVPLGRALERNERYIRQWLRNVWPSLVERACRRKRTIVFADESFSQKQPNVRRTWAPEGPRPELRYRKRREKLSLISGVTFEGKLSFEVHRDNLSGTEVNWFLEPLLEEVPGRIMVIWDNGNIHRSEEGKAFLWEHRDRLETHRLPPCAPGLNPDEFIGNVLKCQRLANFCPTTVEEKERVVRREPHRMQRQPEKLRSGVQHAGTFPAIEAAATA